MYANFYNKGILLVFAIWIAFTVCCTAFELARFRRHHHERTACLKISPVSWLPFLGNVRAIDLTQPIESLMSLARAVRADLQADLTCWHLGSGVSVDLVSEICDDARFDKVITAGLSILAERPS